MLYVNQGVRRPSAVLSEYRLHRYGARDRSCVINRGRTGSLGIQRSSAGNHL